MNRTMLVGTQRELAIPALTQLQSESRGEASREGPGLHFGDDEDSRLFSKDGVC
jgi:hypothetical protein